MKLRLQWHISIVEAVTGMRTIFGEALPYKLWVHMAIKGLGCYRRIYHATPRFGGMCLTKLKGLWASLLHKNCLPWFSWVCYSHSGSSNTSHHLRWPFCRVSDVQHTGSPQRTGTSQQGTTYTQTQLAAIKPEGAQICKKCSPPALWKEGRGKKKTKGVLLGVPWQVLASLTSLSFKGHVEVPVSEIRKVFKKIF